MTKPIQAMTLGWRGFFPAQSSGGNDSQTITFEYQDLYFSVAAPVANYTAATGTFVSPFASVRVKKVEVWELNGNPISLTFSQSQVATTFTSGADMTVTDVGTAVVPSYVSFVPRLGTIAANWFSGSTTTNMFIINDQIDSINATGSNAMNLAIRVHINYTLNDADASPVTYTSTAANTVQAAKLYWRQIAFNGNVLKVDAQPSIATYLP
jgi:hypothetical protein